MAERSFMDRGKGVEVGGVREGVRVVKDKRSQVRWCEGRVGGMMKTTIC